ncbi:hypothetical protein BDM02DRAFT_3186250 [Thelephora ganbajun]|uniref:Uncharacterized protein n=1 Tax=Thelephora ganbajun TaxID=370292 RepID=A0ACB6ZI66_THEGA|nr:hypothetical protein BDM02DRAFT_3186250 [Thelephora ganbajun]
MAMGLGRRRNTYIKIQTKPWPKVPPKEKSALYQMVRDMSELHSEYFIVSFVDGLGDGENRVSIRRTSSSVAQRNNELPGDPHYDYLKANSAKRRKDAPRGSRLGLPKRQADASNSESQDPGPPEAGPSSLPNVNTDADEEMMDSPNLFGFNDSSSDENDSSLDDDLDLERQE